MSDALCLARFVDEKTKLGPAGLVRLYTPPEYCDALSVFTATGAPQEDMLEAGKYVARTRQKRHLYGWAVLPECAYESLSLQASIDGIPTFGKCCHANVIGWPSGKNERIRVAQKLVEHHKTRPVYKLPERADSEYAPE